MINSAQAYNMPSLKVECSTCAVAGLWYPTEGFVVHSWNPLTRQPENWCQVSTARFARVE